MILEAIQFSSSLFNYSSKLRQPTIMRDDFSLHFFDSSKNFNKIKFI